MVGEEGHSAQPPRSLSSAGLHTARRPGSRPAHGPGRTPSSWPRRSGCSWTRRARRNPRPRAVLRASHARRAPSRTHRVSLARLPWSRGRPRRARPRSRQASRLVPVGLDARRASLPAPPPGDRRSRGVARSRGPARAGEAVRSPAFPLASRRASSPALSAPERAGDRAPAAAVERTCGRTVQPGSHAPELPKSAVNCLLASPFAVEQARTPASKLARRQVYTWPTTSRLILLRAGRSRGERARARASKIGWLGERAHRPARGLGAAASGVVLARARWVARRAGPSPCELARALASSHGARRADSCSCQPPRCPASTLVLLPAAPVSRRAGSTSRKQPRRPAESPSKTGEQAWSRESTLGATASTLGPPASRLGARRPGPAPGELLGPSASVLFELRACPPSGAPARRSPSALPAERARSNSVASALELRRPIRCSSGGERGAPGVRRPFLGYPPQVATNPFHERLLAIVLRLPGAYEDRPWGSVHCKVAGKIFVGWGRHDDGEMGMGIRVDKELQSTLVASDPRFTIAKYVGQHGGVDMRLGPKPDWAEVEQLIVESYRIIAPKRLVKELDARDGAGGNAAPKKKAPAPKKKAPAPKRAPSRREPGGTCQTDRASASPINTSAATAHRARCCPDLPPPRPGSSRDRSASPASAPRDPGPPPAPGHPGCRRGAP